MATTKIPRKDYDTAFDGYTGTKRWYVRHPAFSNSLTVAAPDSDSAMKAAADFWGQPFTAYAFYAYATATPKKK